MNTMTKETLFKYHMVYIIKLFNEIKILGARIDRKTKVDLILETL